MKTGNLLKRTLDLSSNKFVEACAGAGKTFALTKRYCAILNDFLERNPAGRPEEEWFGVSNILVLTFTKAAATEMSERIYHDLNKLLNGNHLEQLGEGFDDFGNAIRDADAEIKKWLRAEFANNEIGTIDSFCANILREHADLLQLSPDFKMEEGSIESKFFFDTLERFIYKKSENRDESLKVLLNNCSERAVYSFFEIIHDKRIFINSWLESFTKDSELIKKEWIERLTHPFDVEQFLSEIALLMEFKDAPKDQDDKSCAFFELLSLELGKLDVLESDLEKRRYIVINIIPLFMTSRKKDYRTKMFGNQNKWNDKAQYEDYKAASARVLTYLSDNFLPEDLLKTPSELDLQAIPVQKALVDLYYEFEKNYEKAQRENNFLSFNDVLRITLQFLKDPKTRPQLRRLQNRYHHILFDEFQDTNDIRWEIIELVASNESGQLCNNGLFIVGDKKQSIYRFQQTDVEVMARTGTKLEEQNSTGQDIKIGMNQNFRSSRNYIDSVINPLFERIFPSEEQDLITGERKLELYEAPFQETFPAPHVEKLHKSIEAKTPCTALLQYSLDNNDKAASARSAVKVANEFLEWGRENGFGLDGKPVVALLLRSFTNIQHYLSEFRKHNVPFEIVGGRKLFSQQEAYDLFHLVSVLVNPFDDYALTGLLRSPFFALDDNEINQLFNKKNDYDIQKCKVKAGSFSLYQFICKLEKLSEIESLIKNNIESWRKRAATEPLDRLLQKIFSADECEFGYYSERGGVQRIANIDKLIAIIHDFSLEGASLSDVHQLLKYMIEKEIDQKQADLPGVANVLIMTIHQSKGREFPAVILPELQRAKPSDTDKIAFGRLDKENLYAGITLDGIRDGGNTNFLSAIRAQERTELDAEEKRLFYVAVTRAQYRVAFLADFKEGNKTARMDSIWGKYIKPAYGFPEKLGDYYLPIHSLMKRVEISRYFIEPDDQISDAPLAWTEVPVPVKTEKYLTRTASDIPVRNIPHLDTFEGKSDFNQTQYGTLFHEMMEQWSKDPELVDFELFDRVDEKQKERLKTEFEIFRKSALCQQLSEAKRIYSELPVVGWLNNQTTHVKINGDVDLLYFDGIDWTIVDFKTSQKLDEKIESYKNQVRTYQWMVRQIYGIEAKGKLYFSAKGDIIEVERSDDYLSQIFPDEVEEGGDFVVSALDSKPIDGVLNDILNSRKFEKKLIVTPTLIHSENIMRSLAAKKMLTPDIEVKTINKLLSILTTNVMTLGKARLIVGDLMKQGSDFTLTKYLAQAFVSADSTGSEPIDRYKHMFAEYLEKKADAELLSERDISESKFNQEDLSDKTVIVEGLFKTMAHYFDFLKSLSIHAGEFYFRNNFTNDSYSKSFGYKPIDWKRKCTLPEAESGKSYELCFNVEDEVRRAAWHIMSDPDWQDKTDEIKIAVSSMERYVPIIKNIFGGYGIPTRVAKKEPLAERPVIQLFLAYLNLMESKNPTWEDVTNFFLHPIMEPKDEKDKTKKVQEKLDELLRLDCFLRRKGINSLKEIQNRSSYLREELNIGIDDILEEVKGILKTGQSSPDNILRDFKECGKIKDIILSDSLTKKAINELSEIIGETGEQCRTLNISLESKSFFREVRQRIKEAEIASVEQEHGFEIIGFLDSVHLQPEKLLVLGMIEGEIPAVSKGTLFVQKSEDYSYYFNMNIFSRWQKMSSKVLYFAPRKDLQGNSLQPSTFLEFVQNKTRPAVMPTTISKREYFSKFCGRRIEKSESRHIRRHNDYLNKYDSPYRGNVSGESSTQIRLSATSLERLARCPMQYWFKKKLNLNSLEFNEEDRNRLVTGLIVHKALELFGKRDGFAICNRNETDGVLLLLDMFDEALNEYGIDLFSRNESANLLLYNRFRWFLGGLKDQNDSSLLVQLLQWNKDVLKDFNAVEFESTFGQMEESTNSDWPEILFNQDDLSVEVHGQIDKVMLSKDESTVLATDYKTGKLSDYKKDTVFQPFIYYLALKKRFPDKSVLFAYEQIKSFKDNLFGIKKFLGDIEAEALLPDKQKLFAISDSEERPDATTVSLIMNRIFVLALKIIKGNYHLATQEKRKDVCPMCDYSRICRKDSLFEDFSESAKM